MSEIISFILGLFFGELFGIIAMCLCVISKKSDIPNERSGEHE